MNTYIHVHSTYEGKSTLHLTAQLVQLELWLHVKKRKRRQVRL